VSHNTAGTDDEPFRYLFFVSPATTRRSSASAPQRGRVAMEGGDGTPV
jgi:hypothetical protein